MRALLQNTDGPVEHAYNLVALPKWYERWSSTDAMDELRTLGRSTRRSGLVRVLEVINNTAALVNARELVISGDIVDWTPIPKVATAFVVLDELTASGGDIMSIWNDAITLAKREPRTEAELRVYENMESTDFPLYPEEAVRFLARMQYMGPYIGVKLDVVTPDDRDEFEDYHDRMCYSAITPAGPLRLRAVVCVTAPRRVSL